MSPRDLRPVLRTGGLANYDTLTCVVPCKVLAITGTSGAPSSEQRVRVRFTAARGPWKKFQEWETSALHVCPRDAYRPRLYGARIGYYTVQCDKK